ncbi:hypothetical protein [Candidatus Spongiihabitans sp.]|uniref:hypothetical protein n=1 Tax=Candidatus Spongiihabitans sp. TaxID=3101308 RepID=UPI003C7E26D5
MLPDQPWLVKCPHCQALVWADEQEKIGEVDPFRNSGATKSAKSYSAPELHDYFSKLKTSDLSEKKEQYLRLRAWWAGNDKRRGANKKQNLSDEERGNLQLLEMTMSA